MSDPHRTLGDFEIIRELGRGGMGVVYEARQISLDRRVALKVLPPALGLSSRAARRFEREARAAAKLHHTNIVPVHAIGEQDGFHFYAMELIEGESLDHVLGAMSGAQAKTITPTDVTRTSDSVSSLPPPASSAADASTSVSDSSATGRPWFRTVARRLAEVADALHYAHDRGIVHRDIKPGNLMLSSDGRLCVTDFGLARMLEEPGMTVSGSLLGTPAYMAPEQVAAGRVEVDHRADIYSLGAVLYESLTLHRPFPAATREQVLSDVLAGDPRRPRRFNPKIPLDLETICLKAMEKNPERRYRTAGEMAEDLRRYLQGGLISARRASLATRAWKTVKRHPTVSVALLAVVILAAAGGLAWRLHRAQQVGEQVRLAVSEARRDIDSGLYRDGLAKVDRALALAPEDSAARLLRARLLFETEKVAMAVDEASAILKRAPGDWTAHLILAQAAGSGFPEISRGEHLDAVHRLAPETAASYHARALVATNAEQQLDLLNAAIERDPAHAEALFSRIVVYRDRLKDFPAALEDCERLIIARARSGEGWRVKASVHAARYDWPNALDAIERALEVDPDDAESYRMRGWIRRGMGERERALEDLKRASELNPDNPVYSGLLAQLHNELGQFEPATRAARNAIAINADHRAGWFQLFRALLGSIAAEDVETTEGDPGPEAMLLTELEALATRADGWVHDEARAESYRQIADGYRKLKRYDEAERMIDAAIRADRDEFWNHIFARRLHAEVGDSAAAQADCDAASAIEASDPGKLRERGWRMIFDCRRQEQAVADFTRVIELAPHWHDGYFGRGTSYYYLRRGDEAIADLTAAVERAPSYYAPYGNRALVYKALNRRDEMLADLERSLALNPHVVQGWINLGHELLAAGRVEEALAHHERAIELDPRSMAHASRAEALAWLGRCDEAAAALARAEEVDAGNPQGAWNIAGVHYSGFVHNCPERYDPETALRYARFAYEASPRRFQRDYATALYRAGQYGEAKRLLTEIHEQDPDASWEVLAMCHWQLGDRERARELIDGSAAWVERHFPDHPAAAAAIDEAARLIGG
jgi:serine/threonine protein kinase/Flp pilus assembly protein TadD